MKDRITITLDEKILDGVDQSRGNITRSLFINTLIGYGLENNIRAEKITRGIAHAKM